VTDKGFAFLTSTRHHDLVTSTSAKGDMRPGLGITHALAKARPGQLTYGSSGAGGGPHLAGELLQLMARIR